MTGHNPDILWTGQSWSVWKDGWHPRGLFSKKELRCHTEIWACTAARPTKREEGGCNLLQLSTLHGLIKGLHKRVDYWCWPGANAQSGQFRPHSGLRAWSGNWAPVITVGQTEPPFLGNHGKEKKLEPSPPLPAGSGKTRKTGLKV